MLRYFETFFRNRWLIMIPALILLFSGASLVLQVRPEYPATTTIWTEHLAYLDLPRPANRWLTPSQVQRNRLDELRKTNSFARSVVDRTPVGANGSEAEKAKLVDQVQHDLWLRDLGENSLRLGFTHTDANVALSVVETTIQEYQRVVTERAQLQSSEAVAFYNERIREYAETIVPQTGKAVEDYLAAHPELRDAGTTAIDPNFALLQQQADAARDEMERFQQRLEEVVTQSEAVNRNQLVAFRVLDPPAVVANATISKKTLLMYAGVGLALACAYTVLYVLVATELDRTMRSAADVSHRLKVPVLEVIPEYTPQDRIKRRWWSLRRRRRTAGLPVGSTATG